LASLPAAPGTCSRVPQDGRGDHPTGCDSNRAYEASHATPAGGLDAGGPGFEQFIDEHYRALTDFLARRTGEDDAQDLAQETLLRLMRYRSRPRAQLTRLMYRIAINALNDRRRRESRRPVWAHVHLGHDVSCVPSFESDQDEQIAHEQLVVIVRAAIRQLPARRRQMYLLHRLHGMTYGEIARHCGISLKAVEKHVGKALASLRLTLRQSGVDGC
jgi:RNA polymerase sigma factor (sigma-70 family)